MFAQDMEVAERSAFAEKSSSHMVALMEVMAVEEGTLLYAPSQDLTPWLTFDTSRDNSHRMVDPERGARGQGQMLKTV